MRFARGEEKEGRLLHRLVIARRGCMRASRAGEGGGVASSSSFGENRRGVG